MRQRVCEVVVMGNNGFDETIGYCNTGDIPTFKIYDVSESQIYNATPDKIFPWNTMSNDPFLIVTLIAYTTSAAPCKE